MPFGRVLPLLAAIAACLVLATAQRMLLLWLLWDRLSSTPREALLVLARGARADLAVTAVPLLVIAIWWSLVPQRAWASRWHRAVAWLSWSGLVAAGVTFLVVDGLQFLVHHARLGEPVRERLVVAFRLLARGEGATAMALVVALGSLVASAFIVAGLHRAWRVAARERAALLLRARDLVLILAAGVLALALLPRGAAFADRPVLAEIAHNAASLPAARLLREAGLE